MFTGVIGDIYNFFVFSAGYASAMLTVQILYDRRMHRKLEQL